MPRQRVRRSLVSVALLVGSMVAVVPGAAAEDGTEVHCVVEVVGETPGGELVVDSMGCYSSFPNAVAVASRGTVRLASETGGQAVFTDPRVGGLLSDFTLGIHFDGYNGTGSSITVVGSSCSGGYWNTPSWFANRISSSYNGCYRLVHYDWPDLAGASKHTVGAGATHNLTTFNNQTESVRYLGW